MYSIDSETWLAESKGVNRQTKQTTLVHPHLDSIGTVICTVGYSIIYRTQLQLQRRFDLIFADDASVRFASWHVGDKRSSL